MKYATYDVKNSHFTKQDKINMFIGALVVLAFIFWINYTACKIISPLPDKIISPIPDEASASGQLAPQRIQTPTPTQKPVLDHYRGKASYYSIDGCLGCNPGRIMANGETLDDTKMTLAHNVLPLNTWVDIINTRNGNTCTAKVTDRGGFAKYHRIADLSLAAAQVLELKTDTDEIIINVRSN